MVQGASRWSCPSPRARRSRHGPSSQGIRKTTTSTAIKPAQTPPPGERALSTEVSAARTARHGEIRQPARHRPAGRERFAPAGHLRGDRRDDRQRHPDQGRPEGRPARRPPGPMPRPRRTRQDHYQDRRSLCRREPDHHGRQGQQQHDHGKDLELNVTTGCRRPPRGPRQPKAPASYDRWQARSSVI